MAKKIKCPALFCGGIGVPVGANKNYKAGKGLLLGAVGSVAIGPAGAIAGLASGFNGKKKTKFVCQKCGRVFTVKL